MVLADLAGIDRQHAVQPHRRPAQRHPAEHDAIVVGRHVQRVADAERGDDEAEALAELFAHAGDTADQGRALALIDQRHQAIADLDRDQRRVADVIERDAGGIDGRDRRGLRGQGARGGLALFQRVPQPEGQPGGGQEHPLRHRRDAGDGEQDQRHRQPPARIGELAADLAGEIALGAVAGVGDAGDDDGGGDREEQRRYLRHQRIADGEGDVALCGLGGGEAVGDHAEHEAGADVDAEDQQRGNRIALHELAGAVHRAVEIGLGGDFLAAGLGFIGLDQAGREIGVDRHLLAGQGIQREAGGDFRDAARALGDHHQVDDHQDREDEQTDDEVAADQEGAETLDDMAGGLVAFMAVDQHDAGGGDVERQPQQRGEQQHRGECAEIEDFRRVHRRHQHRHRQRDIDHEEHIQQRRRDRHHHQHDQRQDAAGQREGAGLHRRQELAHPAHSPNAAMRP